MRPLRLLAWLLAAVLLWPPSWRREQAPHPDLRATTVKAHADSPSACHPDAPC